MRWLRWISLGARAFSWRVIYLEIFRWHHMTRTLRFNPPPAPPGVDRQPQAGLATHRRLRDHHRRSARLFVTMVRKRKSS